MSVITIPKRLASNDDLVVIPRKEYEFLRARAVKEFTPTKAQIRALHTAEKRFARGNVHAWDDVKRDMADRHRR